MECSSGTMSNSCLFNREVDGLLEVDGTTPALYPTVWGSDVRVSGQAKEALAN
jgi:hypothetical protein